MDPPSIEWRQWSATGDRGSPERNRVKVGNVSKDRPSAPPRQPTALDPIQTLDALNWSAQSSRSWHQRGQSLHQPQRRHRRLRGSVAPGCLELEHHRAGGVELHPFVRQRLSGDVAAQLLQRLAVVGAAAHGCVQAKDVDVNAQVLLEASSLGMTPGTVSTFLPARGPKATP
jgi:hypothetical protein